MKEGERLVSNLLFQQPLSWCLNQRCSRVWSPCVHKASVNADKELQILRSNHHQWEAFTRIASLPHGTWIGGFGFIFIVTSTKVSPNPDPRWSENIIVSVVFDNSLWRFLFDLKQNQRWSYSGYQKRICQVFFRIFDREQVWEIILLEAYRTQEN